MILAHNNIEQLKKLVQCLDDVDHEFYIHIDKKSKIDITENDFCLHHSKMHIFSNFKVYWGDFSMVEVDLFLFKIAAKRNFDYYHLLSGQDLPIKPIHEIKKFYEDNNGKEFIDVSLDSSKTRQVKRRAKYYYFFQKYRKSSNKLFSHIVNNIVKLLVLIQILLHIDRLKKLKFDIYAGSQWVSISNTFVHYLLSKSNFIRRIFKYTNCCDELLFQSLALNSDFKDKLYFENNKPCNKREIIWEKSNTASPHTWTIQDLNYLQNSSALFARKFNKNIDSEIIDFILNMHNNTTQSREGIYNEKNNM